MAQSIVVFFFTLVAFTLSAAVDTPPPTPAKPLLPTYEDNGNVDRIVKGAISQINLLVRQTEVLVTDDLLKTAAQIKQINDDVGVAGNIAKVFSKVDRLVNQYNQRLLAQVQSTESQINDVVRDAENEIELVTAGAGVDVVVEQIEEKIDATVAEAEDRITALANEAAATIRRIVRHSEIRVRKLSKRAKGKKDVKKLQDALDNDVLKSTHRAETELKNTISLVNVQANQAEIKVQKHAGPLTGEVPLTGDVLETKALYS